MRNNYLLVVALLSIAGLAHGFYYSIFDYRNTLGWGQSQKQGLPISFNSGLARVKPLSTAGAGVCGLIPRLEPGLRLSKFNNYYYNANATISTFSLDWLTEFENSNPAVPNIKERVNKLFGTVSEKVVGIARLSEVIVNYIRKVAATTAVIASSIGSGLSLLPLKRISLAANTAIAAVATAPRVVHASALKKYKKLSPTEKLATTPLYFVSNSRGNAYLQEDVQAGNPDQRIITYFMSSEDANDYLNEMAQINSGASNEFRISTVSMEKIVNQIQSRKQSRKLGRYEMDIVYRIQPSSRQCENADRIAGNGNLEKGKEALKGVSIPMFSSPGLAIKRSNKEMVTPYYFAYEDLQDDLARAAKNSKSSKALTATPKIIVKDFTEVMCLSQGISKEYITAISDITRSSEVSNNDVKAVRDIKNTILTPGIVPPRREIEMIRKYYRNQSGVKNEYSRAKFLGSPKQ